MTNSFNLSFFDCFGECFKASVVDYGIKFMICWSKAISIETVSILLLILGCINSTKNNRLVVRYVLFSLLLFFQHQFVLPLIEQSHHLFFALNVFYDFALSF